MTLGKVGISDENIFAYLATANWVLLFLISLAAVFFGSIPFAASVVAGGLLAIINFYWLLSVLKRVLQMPAQQASRFAQLRYLLRLAILGVVIWLLIHFASIDIIGLLLGLSITVLNIIALALYRVAQKGG